jgi:hypothetical protein
MELQIDDGEQKTGEHIKIRYENGQFTVYHRRQGKKII